MTIYELTDSLTTEQLRELVCECNSWNGSLEDLEVFTFDDEFFAMFFNGNPLEAARATFFGDIRSWNDDYIRFNAYGNLESCSEYEYNKRLEDFRTEIVDTAMELFKDGHLTLSDELEALFAECATNEEVK
jgi:hypothetical protein